MLPRVVWPMGLLCLGMAALAAGAGSSENWVPDERASSQMVLPHVLATRLSALNFSQARELSREVMAEDLHLALAATKPAGKLHGASTRNTLLPKEISRKQVILADNHFFYLLEINLKSSEGQTRITAQAKPVYRQAEAPARQEAVGEGARPAVAMVFAGAPEAGDSGKAERMLIISTSGPAAGARVRTLPDAAERGAGLVRAFMFLLDQRLAAFSARSGL